MGRMGLSVYGTYRVDRVQSCYGLGFRVDRVYRV